MKQLTAQDKELSDRLFSDSFYKNEHLGWLSAWELPTLGLGNILLLEHNNSRFFAAFQDIAPGKQWLHSFFQETDTEPFSFREFAGYREIFSQKTIFSISSHSWYAQLLKFNGFTQCDAVIQMETESLRLSDDKPVKTEIRPFDIDTAQPLRKKCESAFPLIWRLTSAEFACAVSESPVRLAAYIDRKPAAFLMADIREENCHILRLAVASDRQGEGIASALLSNLFLDCLGKGITNFSVNTNQKNAPAISLYEHFGFEIRGKRFPVFLKQFV